MARPSPEGVAFPERILVATDGFADAERAVELSARIGHRYRPSVYLLSVEPGPHGDPERISLDVDTLAAALGAKPTVLRLSGHADERILATAAAQSVSLLALGSRGLTGLRALGSVSERVAHRARCSVLVARPARSIFTATSCPRSRTAPWTSTTRSEWRGRRRMTGSAPYARRRT